MIDLSTLTLAAGRERFYRGIRLLRACDEDIIARLTTPAEAHKVEFSRPELSPEFTDGKPVRWFLRRTTSHWTGYFYSARSGANGEVIPWESFLEKNALMLLECDPSVTSFVTQPFTLQHPWRRRPRRYTPDILVYRGRQPCVIEVKSLERLSSPTYRLRMRLLKEWLRRSGIQFQFWTEHHIHQQPRLGNAQFLMRYRIRDVANTAEHLIRQSLAQSQKSTIGQLGASVDGGIEDVLTLIVKGVLVVDLNQVLDSNTTVTLFRGAAR